MVSPDIESTFFTTWFNGPWERPAVRPIDAPARVPPLSDARGPRSREDPLAHLVKRAVAGDARSLHELLRAIAPGLRRVVREILGPLHEVEDCVQESLVAVSHALQTFRGDSTVLHFAIRI